MLKKEFICPNCRIKVSRALIASLCLQSRPKCPSCRKRIKLEIGSNQKISSILPFFATLLLTVYFEQLPILISVGLFVVSLIIHFLIAYKFGVLTTKLNDPDTIEGFITKFAKIFFCKEGQSYFDEDHNLTIKVLYNNRHLRLFVFVVTFLFLLYYVENKLNFYIIYSTSYLLVDAYIQFRSYEILDIAEKPYSDLAVVNRYSLPSIVSSILFAVLIILVLS